MGVHSYCEAHDQPDSTSASGRLALPFEDVLPPFGY
jgi:hypothetical protein